MNDRKFAFRHLQKAPRFSAVAVLTLAPDSESPISLNTKSPA
jgi:hypothetical protein